MILPLAAVGIVRSWWKLGAGVILGAVLAFPLGQCSGARNQEAHEKADRAISITEALQQDTKAKEKGAAQALEDAATVADQTEKLANAVAALPDAVPSARRVRLMCEWMRNDPAADLSNLPVACRP